MDDGESNLQQKLPVVVVEDVDLVRVEKSLHSLGFFASATPREMSRTVVQVFRRPDGQRVQAKAVIEAIPSLGLPTTADRDKYMAFMKIALDQKAFQGKVANPIRFTGADMIKLLRLRKGGFHYDEINDWCKRMVATTIMSESSIFLADRRQYASDTFHVFDRVVLVGEELAEGVRSDFYQVYLSQWQLNNLNHGYVLPLDFNAYLELNRDISKALFGHLSIWFYASRGQSVDKKYTDLCQLLHIRAYPHLSKARSVLEPSLNELVAIEYLSSWELTRTSSAGDFKLTLSPGNRLLSLPNFANLGDPARLGPRESQLPDWVGELIERGVGERRARQLALDIPDDQPVSDQIDYAEHLVREDQRSRGKIANPAGFLIWAIESNLSVPREFETRRKKALRQSKDLAESSERVRALELQNEYDEYCARAVEGRLARDYSPDRLEAELQAQVEVIRREQPAWFNRVAIDVRRELAMTKLKAKIRAELSLMAFEEWRRRPNQSPLLLMTTG